MTSVAVPGFVMALMENEIVSIIERTLEATSRCTNVPIERLKKEIEKEFDMKLRIIPIEEEELKITKVRRRKVIPDECRCSAQVKKDNLFKPCSFSRCEKSIYCTRHAKKYGDSKQELTPSKDVQKLRKLY